MRASCYGPGARGLPVNVRVNAHILPRTRLMHTHTHTHKHTDIRARTRSSTNVYAMVTAIYHRTSRVITWRATRERISHLAANGICFLPPAAFPRLVHSILHDRARPLCGEAARMSSLICARMTRRMFHRWSERDEGEISKMPRQLDVRCSMNGHSLRLVIANINLQNGQLRRGD